MLSCQYARVIYRCPARAVVNVVRHSVKELIGIIRGQPDPWLSILLRHLARIAKLLPFQECEAWSLSSPACTVSAKLKGLAVCAGRITSFFRPPLFEVQCEITKSIVKGNCANY